MDKWVGKVAVVTGASSGIGRATALKMAQEGMVVAALARRQERLQELSKEVTGKGKIVGYPCDVSDEKSIQETFKKIEKELGVVRVLINNAGIALTTSFTEFDLNKWKQMFNVNVFGLAACTKEVMESKKRNNITDLIHIVNINSVAGHRVPNLPDTEKVITYSMTKHCVTFMNTNFIRFFNKDNIKFTSLSPGAVRTEILVAGGWEGVDRFEGWNFLESENVADGVLHVLSTPEKVMISEYTIKPTGEQ